MPEKKIQKMFYCSDQRTKKIIENRIEDIAIQTHNSSSLIIENILLDRLLPRNRDARFIIQSCLYADEKQGSVQQTLDSLFSYNASGINWKSKHNNFKPILEFCIYYSIAVSSSSVIGEHLHYLSLQLRDIVDRIQNCANACIEPVNRRMYSSQSQLAELLLDIVEHDSQEIVLKSHFQLVYDCWDLLCDCSVTYAYLGCLVRMCDFREDVNARNQLCNIIIKISDQW